MPEESYFGNEFYYLFHCAAFSLASAQTDFVE